MPEKPRKTDPVPSIVPGSHPIESKSYIIETPAISVLCDDIGLHIRNRATGAMIAGRKRIGKSFGIVFAAKVMAERFPGLPIGTFELAPDTRVSQQSFLEDFLEDIGSSLIKNGRNPDKRRRIINFIHQKATACSYSAYLLFIDEAQVLQEMHYRWLIYISNRLKRRGVDLIVLLIGQDELFAYRAALVQGQKNEIVGRFMSMVSHFHGIQTLGQLKACLKSYDEASEYPAGSGCSFVRFYLPKAFDAGWRMESLSELIWSAFRHASRSETNAEEREIPMQHFCRTAERILMELASPTVLVPDASPELIAEAVNASGYPQQFSFAVTKPR